MINDKIAENLHACNILSLLKKFGVNKYMHSYYNEKHDAIITIHWIIRGQSLYYLTSDGTVIYSNTIF